MTKCRLQNRMLSVRTAVTDMNRLAKLSDFLVSVWAQARVSLSVGVAMDDSAARPGEPADRGPQSGHTTQVLASKSPGRIMRNGLGSLEVGAARDRVDE